MVIKCNPLDYKPVGFLFNIDCEIHHNIPLTNRTKYGIIVTIKGQHNPKVSKGEFNENWIETSMLPRLPLGEDEIEDAFDVAEYIEEQLEEWDEDDEDEFSSYKELSLNKFEKTDRWDARNYEPSEWELYLRELGTNAY
jgi:hypothetical protein